MCVPGYQEGNICEIEYLDANGAIMLYHQSKVSENMNISIDNEKRQFF